MQLIPITVEGKVDEDFDELVGDWIEKSASPRSGKSRRLTYLQKLLGIENRYVKEIRYQLLHRTASALILAERFNAYSAVMLVHSFSQSDEHFDDYLDFLDLLDAEGGDNPDSVAIAGNKNGIDLYLAWVRGEERFLRK